MLPLICIYVITNVGYFLLPTAFYLLLLLFLILFSLKIPRVFMWMLHSMFLYSMNSNLFFLLNSFVSRNLNDFVAFSSGLTMLLIAIIYGVAAAVFSHSKSNSIFYRDTYHLKILFAFFVVFIIAHIDFFAYKKILFSIILITIICTIQIIFLNTNFPISLFAIRKRTTLVCFFTVILLTLSMSFLAASKETKVVAWPVDRGVWANTEEKYGTNDWTLKSSYSYSLLKEFMERKYQVENITDLSNLDPAKRMLFFLLHQRFLFLQTRFLL